jgi:hypothetical protein
VRGLGSEDFAALARVLAAHAHVLLGYVHGSALRADAEAHDLDLGVVLDGPEPVDDVLVLAGVIERTLGAGPVDLRVLEECPLFFQHLVVGGGRCVYERAPGLRAAYEGRVVSEFLEFKPVLDQYNRAMVGHALRGFHGR